MEPTHWGGARRLRRKMAPSGGPLSMTPEEPLERRPRVELLTPPRRGLRFATCSCNANFGDPPCAPRYPLSHSMSFDAHRPCLPRRGGLKPATGGSLAVPGGRTPQRRLRGKDAPGSMPVSFARRPDAAPTRLDGPWHAAANLPRTPVRAFRADRLCTNSRTARDLMPPNNPLSIQEPPKHACPGGG